MTIKTCLGLSVGWSVTHFLHQRGKQSFSCQRCTSNDARDSPGVCVKDAIASKNINFCKHRLSSQLQQSLQKYIKRKWYVVVFSLNTWCMFFLGSLRCSTKFTLNALCWEIFFFYEILEFLKSVEILGIFNIWKILSAKLKKSGELKFLDLAAIQLLSFVGAATGSKAGTWCCNICQGISQSKYFYTLTKTHTFSDYFYIIIWPPPHPKDRKIKNPFIIREKRPKFSEH